MDVPSQLAEEIGQLIQSGRYKSPHDFLIVAIQNQIHYEHEPVDQSIEAQDSRSGESVSGVRFQIDPELAALVLPPNVAKVKTVSLSNIERPGCLWGQYNRFFPVKIAARVAANLITQQESDYVSLDELQGKSAEIARLYGKTTQKMDRQYGRKRGTIISAGLPIARDAEKAKLRFRNQFVGHAVLKIENEKTVLKIYGAAPTLKFLDMKNEKKSVLVGITEFGLKFASLLNPVIDQQEYSSALSADEVEFLLEHIATQVPEEAKLIHLILSGVKKGIATPNELNERVKADRSDWEGNEPSMMRAGIVSRIGELGLLERRKDGVKVTYLLTDLGEKYLERLSKLEA